jgi:hypothetical protein
MTAADRVQELGIDDVVTDVIDTREPRRRFFPKTRRIPSVLVFPAWVVSNQTRTKHLHLANPLAAFECDGQGAEGLQQGLPYWFVFQVPLEIVMAVGAYYRMMTPQELEGYIIPQNLIYPGYQMKWNPDFDGYHPKGRIVLPRGRRGKEVDRHRWDLHNYEMDGAGLKSAIRCDDDEVHEFAARESKNLVELYDRNTGLPHEKKFPWGFLSAVIGGRRMF